jgi:archaellum component FlaC
MLNNRKIICLLSSAFIFAIASLPTQVFAANINEVMQEGENRADAGATDQTKIDSVADQTEKIINDFRSITKVVDGLRVYNALLQTQLNNQESEMQALKESISNVALIERQIIPLMTRMVDALDEFVKLDTPFLMKERTERVERLRGMMERSDVTAAEKFRRVIEGYQIENDYGRTIEAYKGSTEINGNQLEVDFLRIGRVALLYQTVGGATTGAWDKESGAFVELPPATYQKQVSDGLKIARKQVAPDLLVVPVGAPTRAMQ